MILYMVAFLSIHSLSPHTEVTCTKTPPNKDQSNNGFTKHIDTVAKDTYMHILRVMCELHHSHYDESGVFLRASS